MRSPGLSGGALPGVLRGVLTRLFTGILARVVTDVVARVVARVVACVPARVPARVVAAAIVALLWIGAGIARADVWLCPQCDARIERAPDAATLDCAACGDQYDEIDLSPAVMFCNSRTRNVEIAWVVQSDDCEGFRPDGLRIPEGGGHLWVPWSKVEYYIPRQRTLRLFGGQEFQTDYAKGPGICAVSPRFPLELVDTVRVEGKSGVARRLAMDEELAALFVVAPTPELRDSALVRFDREIVAGKHPRLPRTSASLARAGTLMVPAAVKNAGWTGECLLDVRVYDRGGFIELRLTESSGNEAFDREAIRVAHSSAYQPGGEMGVSVPAWIRLRVAWDGATASVTGEPSPLAVWGK